MDIMNGKISLKNINLLFGILGTIGLRKLNSKSHLQKKRKFNTLRMDRFLGRIFISILSELVIDSFYKPDILTNLE